MDSDGKVYIVNWKIIVDIMNHCHLLKQVLTKSLLPDTRLLPEHTLNSIAWPIQFIPL